MNAGELVFLVSLTEAILAAVMYMAGYTDGYRKGAGLCRQYPITPQEQIWIDAWLEYKRCEAEMPPSLVRFLMRDDQA